MSSCGRWPRGRKNWPGMPDSVLDRIVAAVLERQRQDDPAPGLAEAAERAVEERERAGRRSLRDALGAPGLSVIAECKHASPSAGVLREPFDPVALARAYQGAGAAAISVVTEPDFFGGDPTWLPRVRDVVRLPVLRKDFIVNERQLLETAAAGADAVLLIQRLLTAAELAGLLRLAADLRLDALVELFADEDPRIAVDAGADIIGVNARDLATFATDLERVAHMADGIPSDRIRVAESGIGNRGDLLRLSDAGFDAFLIGEHLVRSEDPGDALRNLLRES